MGRYSSYVLREWPTYSDEELEAEFRRSAALLQEETAFSSNIMTLYTHRAYQRIIGLGPRVVPVILRDMQREPDYWFWALTSITGEDPAEGTISLDAATEKWLQWGLSHNLID